jgi:hypothetical protein
MRLTSALLGAGVASCMRTLIILIIYAISISFSAVVVVICHEISECRILANQVLTYSFAARSANCWVREDAGRPYN